MGEYSVMDGTTLAFTDAICSAVAEPAEPRLAFVLACLLMVEPRWTLYLELKHRERPCGADWNAGDERGVKTGYGKRAIQATRVHSCLCNWRMRGLACTGMEAPGWYISRVR
jgi:hypothetical protein